MRVNVCATVSIWTIKSVLLQGRICPGKHAFEDCGGKSSACLCGNRRLCQKNDMLRNGYMHFNEGCRWFERGNIHFLCGAFKNKDDNRPLKNEKADDIPYWRSVPGTNSLDRVTGARNVLLNLDKDWVIGMISTHDFELCNLEKGREGRIVNYHFAETYTTTK